MSVLLRTYVRLCLETAGAGGVGNAAHQPYSGVGMTMADREQIAATIPDEEPEEALLAPHLRNTEKDADPTKDDLGPVPPKNGGDIYAISDPWSKNWHVLPTPRIFGR